MPQRIEAGTALAALAAVALLVSLFLEWFDPAVSAWNAFEFLDLLLAALALGAVAAAAGLFDRGTDPRPGVLPALGVVALVVVAIQLLDPPPVVPEEAETGIGGWLALVSSSLLLAGGALAVSSISVTVTVRGRDARRRVPAVDRRRAADAETPRGGGPAAAEGRTARRSRAVEDFPTHRAGGLPGEAPAARSSAPADDPSRHRDDGTDRGLFADDEPEDDPDRTQTYEALPTGDEAERGRPANP